jgi:hypothetical protein
LLRKKDEERRKEQTMNKQIDEMAITLCEDYGKCNKCTLSNPECENPCMIKEDCERLYNQGYRKASDVAREIFDDLAKAGITTKVIFYGLTIWDKTDAYCEIKKKYLGSEWVESCVEAAKKAIEDYTKKHESEGTE